MISLAFALFMNATCEASTLEPYQQASLETILATMDPPTQAAARPYLEQSLAGLSEQEVALMLASMAPNGGQEPGGNGATEAGTPGQADGATASAEDLTFNLPQYERAIRSAWEAGRKFDEFVDRALASYCPGRDEYAVWGQAWRYEVIPLEPGWTRASNSADLDVEILGSSYAPQDGRYRFDFSGLATGFDEAAVDRAVADACAEYRKIGDAFLAAARSRMTGDDLPGGFELQQKANAAASEVNQALQQTLNGHAPGSDGALFNALMNAERLD